MMFHLIIISSPLEIFSFREYAIKLIDSVVPEVKIISSSLELIYLAVNFLTCSYS